MATTQLKQTTVLAKDDGSGDCYITIEWLRALTAKFAEVLAEASSSTSTSTDHAAVLALQADVAGIILRLVTLETKAADFESRLRALEGGYQV